MMNVHVKKEFGSMYDAIPAYTIYTWAWIPDVDLDGDIIAGGVQRS